MDVETTAREIGFDHVAAIRADDVVTSRELTASCNPQACPKYGSCWTCPPGVGVFEDILNDITSRDAGVIVQTVREGVDHYEDWDLIEEAHVRHNAKLDQLADVMRTEFADVAEFSTGGCDLCSPCSYPNAPCMKPDRRRESLSAHGVAVGATCERAGLDYSFENGRVRFVGMILHNGAL